LYELNIHYFFGLASDETDNLFLPLARLLAKTLRPLAEAILSLKPCLFLLFLFDGWNVLFGITYIFKIFLLIIASVQNHPLKAGQIYKTFCLVQELFVKKTKKNDLF
jgi:hypothetical protein